MKDPEADMADFTELPDYEWQLSMLREAERMFAQEEQEQTDEESRKLIACNVLVAYYHLCDEASPFRGDLTERDLRTVTIARFFNENLLVRWQM